MKSAIWNIVVCALAAVSSTFAQCDPPDEPTLQDPIALHVGIDTENPDPICYLQDVSIDEEDKEALYFRFSANNDWMGTWVSLIVYAEVVHINNPQWNDEHPWLNPVPTWTMPGSAQPMRVPMAFVADVSARGLYPESEDRVRDLFLPLLPGGPYPVRGWVAKPAIVNWVGEFTSWWTGVTAQDQIVIEGAPSDDATGPGGTFSASALAQQLLETQTNAAGIQDADNVARDIWNEIISGDELALTIWCQGVCFRTTIVPPVPENWTVSPPPGLVGWPGVDPSWLPTNPVPVRLYPRKSTATTGSLWPVGYLLQPTSGSTVQRGRFVTVRCGGWAATATATLLYANDTTVVRPLLYAGPGKMKLSIPVNAPLGPCRIESITNPVGVSTFPPQGWNQFEIID